jgi:hypothetical protein
MVKHIYGKLDLLDQVKRPHMFVKELNLYIDYLQTDLQKHLKELTDKKIKQFSKFKDQLVSGIAYYKQLFSELPDQTSALMQSLYADLGIAEHKLDDTLI